MEAMNVCTCIRALLVHQLDVSVHSQPLCLVYAWDTSRHQISNCTSVCIRMLKFMFLVVVCHCMHTPCAVPVSYYSEDGVFSSNVMVALLLQMLHQRQAAVADMVGKPGVGSLFVPTRANGLQLPSRQHEAAPRNPTARIAGLQRQPGTDDLGTLAGEGLILPGQRILTPVTPVGELVF